MFQKVFEYAGPHKKGLYAATAVVLVSVLMGVLPFVLAYQVIYHPAGGFSVGLSDFAGDSLWLGAQSFAQGRL